MVEDIVILTLFGLFVWQVRKAIIFMFREEPPIKESLCSMCKKYKTIRSDMGDEFCFTCLSIRTKYVLNLKDKTQEEILENLRRLDTNSIRTN